MRYTNLVIRYVHTLGIKGGIANFCSNSFQSKP